MCSKIEQNMDKIWTILSQNNFFLILLGYVISTGWLWAKMSSLDPQPVFQNLSHFVPSFPFKSYIEYTHQLPWVGFVCEYFKFDWLTSNPPKPYFSSLPLAVC